MGIKNIADLLPEGLEEATVDEIAKLVNDVITEQVDQRLKDLEIKTLGFIRFKIDDLKEQALKELAEENEFFHNARIFEGFRSIMELERAPRDTDNAISNIVSEKEEVDEENALLISQLEKTITENATFESNLQALNARVTKLQEENTTLLEQDKDLTQERDNLLEEVSKTNTKALTGKALVITEDVDSKAEIPVHTINEHLTDEMLTLA